MTTFVQPPFWSQLYRALPMHVRSAVVTEPAFEPVSVNEVMNRLKVDSTAEIPDLQGLIVAARRQVEKDLMQACLITTVVDQWCDRPPCGRVLELERWPLQSVTSIKYYDQDDTEATLSSADYLVDTTSQPGRIVLNSGASWPTGLRSARAMVVRYPAGFTGTTKAITSITRSGSTATVTTTLPHGYATANRRTIAGADQAEYNGTFEITVTGATTFTITVSGTPTTPATGVMTVTDLGPIQTYTLAMMMLIAHWFANREAVNIGNITSLLPLAYTSLISDAPVGLV